MIGVPEILDMSFGVRFQFAT